MNRPIQIASILALEEPLTGGEKSGGDSQSAAIRNIQLPCPPYTSLCTDRQPLLKGPRCLRLRLTGGSNVHRLRERSRRRHWASGGCATRSWFSSKTLESDSPKPHDL